MAGGQIDIRVEPDVKAFPGKLESGLSGALGTATKIGSALGLALGAGATAKAVMDIGIDFDKKMNEMSAVSQGTASQMDAVAAKARELGNDTDLTATSASDAAAAMVELSKGGFSVDESMGAAKGTLQLAAAAQIEAADAATIQSQALQAFSLQAGDAARVSDILAGAANASSAEIEGIAQGLQQSGTVANQFGISIEDTSTALAMFANAGIQGSDAGTLLKSALLALTDQGKPAQAAMEELGLSVYDMQGNFVGLPALFDQLQDAQKRMTPEAYQAATAVLFGSDAMRLAGIGAEQGSEGFNKLKEQVTRSGQAAEVAAAQTQGIPGALERAQNAAEDLGLKIYDAVKGPLTDAANAGVDAMEQLGPSIETAASMGASALSGLISAATPVAKIFTDLVGVVTKLPAPLLALGTAIPLAKMTGLTSAASAGGGALRTLGRDISEQRQYFSSMGMEIGRTTAAMALMQERVPTIGRMGDAYLSVGSGMRTAGKTAREAAKDMTGIHKATTVAGGAMKTLGGVAGGVAGGGMSLLKSGASGLMTMMGGPFGVALGVGGAALGILAQKHEEAAQKEAEHKAHQDALRDSLDQTTGAITAQTKELQEKKLRETDGVEDAARAAGVSMDTLAEAATGNAGAMRTANDAFDAYIAKTGESTMAIEGNRKMMDNLGLSYVDIVNAAEGVAGAQEKIDDAIANSGGNQMEQGRYREKIEQIQGGIDETARKAAKARGTIGDLDADLDGKQVEKFEDRMRQLEERAKQTKDILQELNGQDLKLENAGENGEARVSIKFDEATYNDTKSKLEELGAKVSEPINGRVNIAFPEGADILAILKQIGIEASATKDGYIKIDNPDAPECIASLEELGIKTTTLPDGRVVIDSNDPEVRDRLIELGMGYKDMNGDFHLADNIQDVVDHLNGVNGTQTSGNHHQSDDSAATAANIKNNLNSPNGDTYSKHTVTYTVAGKEYSASGGFFADPLGYSLAAGQNATGGRIPRNAAGGDIAPGAVGGPSHTGYRLPTTGPGTHITDGILGISPDGTPMSWLDGGEWVANAKSSREYNDAYYWLNQGQPQAAIFALEAKTPTRPTAAGGAPGVQALASGGVVDSIIGLVNENFPMMTITSTTRNSNDLHGQGKAVDASNGYDDTPEMQSMAQWFYDRYQYQLAELIHSPFGNNVKNGDNVGDGMGFYGADTMSQHRNHVHIAAQAPLDGEDEAWKDRTKDDDKDKSPEEKSRDSAAKNAADEQERRRKMVAESKPEVVQTNVTLGPDPVAQAMFNADNDPDGILSLTRGADFTPRFADRYHVEEDDELVNFLLWAKGGQDEKDDELAAAFDNQNDPRGVRALLEAGVYTQRFGDAFGVGENSALVTAALAAREKGGVNTLRVSAWHDEYGDVDTSVSGIAGKVAKSLVSDAVGDVFAAFGVDDDLGPLTQAAIAGAKYAYGINTGASYEDMQSAASASGQHSSKFSDAYQSMTASEADSGLRESSSGGTGGGGGGSHTYDPSQGAAQWSSTILDALARTGRPAGEEGVTTEQVDIESGGDPGIQNNWDSNAASGTPSGGLLQVIEPTRQSMRQMFPEHHAGLVDDLFDPLENLVAGIDWAIYKYGGPSAIWPTRAGYADGGQFRLLPSGQAAIVPPNTPRLIGDNPTVDEFYLPDDDSSIPTGQAWARRRGLQLTIAGNQRKRDDRMAAAVATQAASGPTYQSHVNVNGFDRQEVAAGIRMAERKARWKEGF